MGDQDPLKEMPSFAACRAVLMKVFRARESCSCELFQEFRGPRGGCIGPFKGLTPEATKKFVDIPLLDERQNRICGPCIVPDGLAQAHYLKNGENPYEVVNGETDCKTLPLHQTM